MEWMSIRWYACFLFSDNPSFKEFYFKNETVIHKGNKYAVYSPFIFPYLLSNLVYLAVFLDRLTDLCTLTQLGSLVFQLLIRLGQWDQGERDWFVGKEVEGFISLAASFRGPWFANGCVPLLKQWLLSGGPPSVYCLLPDPDILSLQAKVGEWLLSLSGSFIVFVIFLSIASSLISSPFTNISSITLFEYGIWFLRGL